jgi:hypothetical protein
VDAVSTYDSIEEYTADVQAARDAYATDRLVEDGWCENDCGRRKGGFRRTCNQCLRESKAAS